MNNYNTYPETPDQLSRQLSEADNLKTNLSELDFLLIRKKVRDENDRLLQKIESLLRISIRKIEEVGTTHPIGYKKKEFMSASEFARKIGMSPSFVAKRCRAGKLQATKTGPRNGWLVHISELERFIEESELNSQPRHSR